MKTFALFFFVAVQATAVLADDAYLVMFSATGATSGCHRADWFSLAYFYNQDTAPATIRLLGISNGELPSGTATTTVVLPDQFLQVPVWAPPPILTSTGYYLLWVMHLDVPPGVMIESTDFVVDEFTCLAEPWFGPTMSVSLPVFRSLIPPGVPQVKLGPGIGSTPARQNVAIYNGGDRVATATIRRVCDAGVVQARTVNIASNTIVQVGGFSSGGANECTLLNYTVVTVDQESLSLVTTITEHVSSAGLAIPIVEFGVK